MDRLIGLSISKTKQDKRTACLAAAERGRQGSREGRDLAARHDKRIHTWTGADLRVSICGLYRSASDSLTEELQAAPARRQKDAARSVDGRRAGGRWDSVPPIEQLGPYPHVQRHVTVQPAADSAVSNVAYRSPKMAIRVEAVVTSDGIAINYHSVDIPIEPTFLAAPCSGFLVLGNTHRPRAVR